MVDARAAGLVLVLIGFGVVVVSMMGGAHEEGRQTKGAGVIMIGPIPIIFGSDARWVSIAVVLAIVLVLLGLFAWWT